MENKEENNNINEQEINNEENNKNVLLNSELNNNIKDLQNGISQDIPNIYTPKESFKKKNIDNKENGNIDKIDEIKEEEKVEGKVEEKVEKSEEKDEKKEEKVEKSEEKEEKGEEKEEKGEEKEEKVEKVENDEKAEKEETVEKVENEKKLENEEKEEINQNNNNSGKNKIDKEKSTEIKRSAENGEKKEEDKENKNEKSNLLEEDESILEKEEKKLIENENKSEKEENSNNILNDNNNNKNNIENNDADAKKNENQEINQNNNKNQNVNVYTENNVNNYNYVYNQGDHSITPIITIKDLQDNPKEKLIINSPYSLKALYDSGYTLEELHYKTFEEFSDEHKDILHIDEEAKMNRFNFYEQLRLDKIKNLVQYREKLIKDEKEKEMIKFEEKEKPMKNIIIDNHIRIAKEQIDVIQKKHEKELANIIELELDKDLFKLEIIKQEEDYNKEYEKLNFLNLNSNGEESENINENENNFEQQEDEKNNRYKTNNNINIDNSIKSQNIRALSSRRKNHIMLNEHNTYLDNLYSLQQAKINQKYEKNQKKNEKKLEKVEKVNKIKAEQMALKKRIEVGRAAQNLQKNAIDFQNRHENLIKEIQMKKLLIYQNKKKFDNYLKEKKEWNYLKYMQKLDYIASLRRKDENLRQLKYEKLKDKQSQRENIKYDRMDVYDTKQLKLYYLNNERKRNIIKIKDILDSGIDEENLEKILQAFPGNKEIDKVIKNYKNQREIIKNGELAKSTNFYKRPKSQGKLMVKSFNKKNNKLKTSQKVKNNDLKIPNVLANKNKKEDNKKNIVIYYESEIRDKIKQYKENVYREFFRHVEDEKKNEDLRNKELENVHDPVKKHELEKRFSKERALVDLRLRRENQNIEEKIRNYEIKLRQNNINNHKYIFKNKY